MTKLFLIATAAILTAAGPVSAREPATASATGEQAAPTRAERPAQRYCVVDTVTGSRIDHKKCLTRAEWMKEGYDPLDATK